MHRLRTPRTRVKTTRCGACFACRGTLTTTSSWQLYVASGAAEAGTENTSVHNLRSSSPVICADTRTTQRGTVHTVCASTAFDPGISRDCARSRAAWGKTLRRTVVFGAGDRVTPWRSASTTFRARTWVACTATCAGSEVTYVAPNKTRRARRWDLADRVAVDAEAGDTPTRSALNVAEGPSAAEEEAVGVSATCWHASNVDCKVTLRGSVRHPREGCRR